MSKSVSPEIRVSADVGGHQHSVAIGRSGGEQVGELEIDHSPEGFRNFFDRIARQEARQDLPESVVMKGYNGYARPPDSMVRLREYRQPVSWKRKPGCSQGQGQSTQSCQEGGRRQVSFMARHERKGGSGRSRLFCCVFYAGAKGLLANRLHRPLDNESED